MFDFGARWPCPCRYVSNPTRCGWKQSVYDVVIEVWLMTNEEIGESLAISTCLYFGHKIAFSLRSFFLYEEANPHLRLKRLAKSRPAVTNSAYVNDTVDYQKDSVKFLLTRLTPDDTRHVEMKASVETGVTVSDSPKVQSRSAEDLE